MKSNKLYLENSYLTKFEAEIIESFYFDNQPAVILNQTAFYPTSGGQMHDIGEINNTPVINVIEDNDSIIHILDSAIKDKKVLCKINWQRRFDFMQQHTAFHILAQCFLKISDKETLSSHLGENISTIDVKMEKIEFNKIKEIENLANQICFENRKVNQFFINPEEIGNYSLRALPAKQNSIRLIDIENFDLDPCGGTHVDSTGQVGIIKIVRWEKIRGYSRFEFYAGKRALSDYQNKSQTCQQLTTFLTESEENLFASVQKMHTDLKHQLKQKINLNKKLLDFEIQALLEETEKSGCGIISNLFENKELSDIRYMAKQILEKKDVVVIFGIRGEKANLVIGRSKNFDFNLKEVVRQIAPIIDGRGGGRPDFVEIGGSKKQALKDAILATKELIEKKIEN